MCFVRRLRRFATFQWITLIHFLYLALFLRLNYVTSEFPLTHFRDIGIKTRNGLVKTIVGIFVCAHHSLNVPGLHSIHFAQHIYFMSMLLLPR